MECYRYDMNLRGDGVSYKTVEFCAFYATEIQTDLN